MQSFTDEELAAERWRDVAGYEGYRVSDLGRIIGSRGWLLKFDTSADGYCRVQLMRSGVRSRSMRVHRLVLEAFVGPCPDGMEVRHFPDFTPTNCRLSNLSYSSKSTNQQDRSRQQVPAEVEGGMSSPSSFPTSLATPHSINGATQSGVFESESTASLLTSTLTAGSIQGITLGSLVPMGPSSTILALRAALVRLNGFSHWSCARSSADTQLAVACIGPLTVTSEGATSELAIAGLLHLVSLLEQGRSEVSL
jgi:hypothetical protein